MNMGLTKESVGARAIRAEEIEHRPGDIVIALAGNPNVGKSTVFNALTGMNQHTGNWPGKTVSGAQGSYFQDGVRYILVDTPGCYSLSAHSAEEEVTRDYVCFGDAEAAIVVCDATCLERNLNLALQVMEVQKRTLLCVNLLDEAERKGITVDLYGIREQLGIPVVGVTARSGKGLEWLTEETASLCAAPPPMVRTTQYDEVTERCLSVLEKALASIGIEGRWLAIRLLEEDDAFCHAAQTGLGTAFLERSEILAAQEEVETLLRECGKDRQMIRDGIVSARIESAQRIASQTVHVKETQRQQRSRRIDALLTSRAFGIPVMLCLLALIFFLTISGANVPSGWLSSLFGYAEEWLVRALVWMHAPDWMVELLAYGAFRVLGWVVSVMLPPMAIFFPLFTLLEDLGYLPRVAFNLDHCFRGCHACGKQALTMCMGFGCNAAGVVGCRIIDSPRERTIAILTNSLVPCNGRLPTLIALLTMFCVVGSGFGASVTSALLLALCIVLSIGVTLLVSRILSATVLRGMPSSFTLELPPYRPPQVGKILIRSLLDRTVYVLGRAAAVALPAGILIWCLANLQPGGQSVLQYITSFLDPVGRFMGMDGVILVAFILGIPANEIVIPLIIMMYTATGSLTEIAELSALRGVLVANGWTVCTAVCTLLFMLFHWPCSTTLLTVWRETKSLKWTVLSFLVPTLCGVLLCIAVRFLGIFIL